MSDLEFMTPSAQSMELQRCDDSRQLPFWPRWMRTRWGAWLARHWKPAAYLWRAEVEIAQHREDEAREMQAALRGMVVLHVWAEDNFPEPMDPELRTQLIGAWCKWRTYHERKCERAGCAPVGSLAWLAAQQRSTPPA